MFGLFHLKDKGGVDQLNLRRGGALRKSNSRGGGYPSHLEGEVSSKRWPVGVLASTPTGVPWRGNCKIFVCPQLEKGPVTKGGTNFSLNQKT